MKAFHIAVALATIALASAASANCKTRTTSSSCPATGDCVVKVELVGADMYVTPETLTVTKGTPRRIRWDVTGATFGSVVFVDGQFRLGEVSGAGTKYKISFTNGASGDFNYAVVVVDPLGHFQFCDPYINNEAAEKSLKTLAGRRK